MGRVARYKRIKAFDPGAKRRPAPPEKGPPKNMAPKHDPDVIPKKLAEMMRMQKKSKELCLPEASRPQPASNEEPHEFYKVKSTPLGTIDSFTSNSLHTVCSRSNRFLGRA